MRRGPLCASYDRPLMPPSDAAPARARLDALDWLRGLVMILMTIDHASGAFNAGKLMTDATHMYKAGTALDPAQFLTRWLTHLCAPAFLFLAGAALARSIQRRTAAGEPGASLDRHLLLRGLLIVALDPLWMSGAFMGWSRLIFQVLYAIGASFLLMIPLRRLPTGALFAVSLVLFFGGEAAMGLGLWLSGGEPGLPVALLLTGGRFGRFIVAYPVLPWLAFMVLGWCFGRVFDRWRAEGVLVRRLAGIAALLLGLFAVVRGLNDYGNVRLLRDDGSLVQWLHVSKYPPSLSYSTLELGLCAAVLAIFCSLGAARGFVLDALGTFGRTAFFFYLLHAHLLVLAAIALGLHKAAGLGATYLATAAGVVVLLLPCRWYDHYKGAHPDGWTRFV